MKLPTYLPACMLLRSVASALLTGINSNTLRRRAYMAYISSSDNLDVETMSKYNCAGMFFDVTGPSEATSGTEQIVVKYAYDLFLEKGSNLTKALYGLQPRLLQHVGDALFTDCASYDSVIQEITMTSNDAQHPTDTCKIEATFKVETDCYPMKGRATVYYTPSGQVDQNDEEVIVETMSTAVRNTMDNSVLVTDTVIAAYFIGERDSFQFKSSEYYQTAGSPGSPISSWGDRNIGWIAGTAVALVAVIVIGICLKRRKKKEASSVDC